MSLRHTRLLRIVTIVVRGQQPFDQRIFIWRGGRYPHDHLHENGVLLHFNALPGLHIDFTREYLGWDRRWRSYRDRHDRRTHRERSIVGAQIRRERRYPHRVNSFYMHRRWINRSEIERMYPRR